MFSKVEWFACLVLLSRAVPAEGGQKWCKEPSESELSKKLDHLEARQLGFSARQFIPGKEFRASHRATSQIGKRSSSPWVYRINEDQARYPRRLMEAHCHLKNCLRLDGNITDTALSVPYYTTVLVLRRKSKCKNKTFIYKRAEEKISLFCVCAMPTESKS
ncbi:interleukin-17D-like [Narcine bancroftii]|uniref:interleukin-17D-like n=1 Tax=Narcine bancroftii TaxID=1343680 RepID=UPI00383129A7